MRRVPVYILAGGRSRRFGSDKARAPLAGEPLLVRVAHALEPVAQRIAVVADRADRYRDLGCVTLADRVAESGPLGGLHAALHDRLERDGPGWLLLASCDLLEIRLPWIERLLARATNEVAAVAFRDARWQPLLALYHTVLLEAVEAQLGAGRRALHELLERGPSAALAPPADLPATWQANTPGELAAYARSVREAVHALGQAVPRRRR